VRTKREAIRTYSFLTEAISGVQTIKAQNAELKTRWEFEERYSRFLGEDFKLRVLGDSRSNLLEFVNNFSQLIFIIVAILLIVQNKLGIGELFAARILGEYVVAPLTQIPSQWQQIQLASQALGIGKSTLLKLLPRSYRPLEGSVLVDGLDISKIELYSLRRQIGVVPQESMLFDGSIRDNLLLVKPDASAGEMIRAARIACAHDFIMELPNGYNTNVGERGAGLSGGQRQRLALARAVLQNPRMLILDEATSALDASTERQVCINLLEAYRGRTVFFITHRLTTVKPADVIVMMDRGAIMEMGNHQGLMEQQGWYYALYRSQTQEGLS
jgi:ABC-type bacteriocin/lantibiotic exporter with double-glycine peptidase domain